MASGVPPEPTDDAHAGAARLTGSQISAISRFPDDNPNPVLRIVRRPHGLRRSASARSCGRSASNAASGCRRRRSQA
jgi:hypothetical protein